MSTLPLAAGTKLVLASHNKGKLAEFSTLLADFGVTVLSAGDLNLEGSKNPLVLRSAL